VQERTIGSTKTEPFYAAAEIGEFMSMVAVFKMSCCGTEIVHGRWRGDDMNFPSREKCPFGCAVRTGLNGKPERFKLKYERHQDECTLTEELKRFAPEPNDYWHKYNKV
jgi:hypothetical protein